jgi:mannosyltransferase OCH1-like enzyme
VFKSQHKLAHISDAARLALLYKYGGFYSDFDTITVRSLYPISKYAAAMGYLWENKDSIGNGFLHFRLGHPLLLAAMNEFNNNYYPYAWGFNGPMLLKKLIKDYCKLDDLNLFKKLLKNVSYFELREKLDYLTELKEAYKNDSLELEEQTKTTSMKLIKETESEPCDVVIYPKEFIYPISWIKYNYRLLFMPDSNFNVSTFINTYSVHFYGKFTNKYKVKPNDYSLYDYFASYNCPNVYNSVKYSNKFLE